MKVDKVLKLSYEDLASYTRNFSKKNYLGRVQFGKLYRGKINLTQDVTVKIWEHSKIYCYQPGDNERRLMDELLLLRHETMTNHTGIVKLYGYCWEGDCLGVVYDFKPFDSLYNLITKANFTWLQRIKVALELASLLKYLHSRKCSPYTPYIVRNLDAGHLVLDQDYKPKLCDFSLISGGIFPDRTLHTTPRVIGSYGYIDSTSFYKGVYTTKVDLFAFGAIIESLISKRVYTLKDRDNDVLHPYEVAWRQLDAYEDDMQSKIENGEVINPMPKFSFVHKSFAKDPDFCPSDGHKLTMLGLSCSDSLEKRPTIKQIETSLLKLNAVKENPDFFGL